MKKKLTFLFLGLIIFAQNKSQAWGGRGHAAICEAAVFLVKDPNFKDFLRNKPQMMSHLCNVPDIYWKTLSSELRKVGDPTHYIDPENLGLKISEIPLSYETIITSFTNQESRAKSGKKILSVAEELGSIWWRADQFFRRALADGLALKKNLPPANSREEQNDDLPFNKNFYSMLVNLGLMGHFVGDASQPFHNTSDYDGYAANHGGIHSYYEDSVVAQFDADLVSRIVKRAKTFKRPKWVQQNSIVENMRLFSEVASLEISEVLKKDPIISPSTIRIEKGMSIKTIAERQPPSIGFKRFEKLILEQLARSSYLLAHLWDEAYKAAGEPTIKAYKSYRYPLTPEFVSPDYLEIKPAPR